jgi:hypothetical protein
MLLDISLFTHLETIHNQRIIVLVQQRNHIGIPDDMKVIFCFFVYAKAKNKFAAANFKNASVFEVKRLSALVKMLRRF